MHLLPHEVDKLLITQCGLLAQRRLSRGLRLNLPEATALIAHVLLELIRDGSHSVSELMSLGRHILGHREVMDGIPFIMREVQVEGTFPDGTKLVTVHEPITRDRGDLRLALYSSGLPEPDDAAFTHRTRQFTATPETDTSHSQSAKRLKTEHGHPNSSSSSSSSSFSSPSSQPPPFDQALPFPLAFPPGYIIPSPASTVLTLNAGRPLYSLHVTNHSDRPIQLGSHFHFAEANAALSFDRSLAYGRRLNVPAGTAVRFEPGERKRVPLVDIAGRRHVSGGNSIRSGPVLESHRPGVGPEALRRGFRHVAETGVGEGEVGVGTIARTKYISMYGPTVGDRIHLGDTGLVAEVEWDYTAVGGQYGDECVFGGGKTLREGMGQSNTADVNAVLDLLICNAVVIDWRGVYKADIGVRGGLIVGIGKGGNGDVMDGVTPGMECGVNTEVMNAGGMIVTAGGVDTHIHFICPQLCQTALASGVTTMIGGGVGPTSGTSATTCTPSAHDIAMMYQATDDIPINIGLTGKGNASDPAGLVEQVRAGVVGLKLHEDWGSTPAAIDCCLRVADEYDVAVTLHTDTLNESCNVEQTIAAIAGRAIHAYHSEGAGGGHAPDIIRVVGESSIIPSSTNPTRPYTVNTVDEHVDMLMVCHHLSKDLAEDVAFAESRIRGETIAAEDVLHDRGAISVMSSDSQAMGRVGETIMRTWQTAAKMKAQRGHLPDPGRGPPPPYPAPGPSAHATPHDNFRIRRYVAKYTVNPALTHGVGHVVGSVEVGRMADLVLWRPEGFGVRCEMVVKGGVAVWAVVGDANGSIPTPQPMRGREMWGALKGWVAAVALVGAEGVRGGRVAGYGLRKRVEVVRGCRTVRKADMKLNDWQPRMEVNPETFEVKADGEAMEAEPATVIPLAQRYAIF